MLRGEMQKFIPSFYLLKQSFIATAQDQTLLLVFASPTGSPVLGSTFTNKKISWL
jgi:hypothetical protein